MTAQCRCRARVSPLVAAILATGTAIAAPTRLADLLRSLSESGFDILYSSDLVPPDLTIPAIPPTPDPLSRARAALAAYHLELKGDGEKRYIVTRSSIPRTSLQTRAPVTAPAPDEVTVFASRYVLKETIGEVVSFRHDDLEQVPGVQEDSMRAIRTVPGLTNNLSSRPYVRGAFLDDVLVRFDDIPMIDPFHFKNFQNLISAFDPATVDRIDVYTGGFPVKYGTRSAGVIDVSPRTLDGGYEHRVGVSLLSYDLSTVGQADRWPIEWLATARHSTPNLVLQPRAGDSGEPSYADSLGRLRWQIEPDAAVILGWMLLDDSVQSSSDPGAERAVAHDRDLYTWITSEWTPSGAMHSRTSVAVTSSERGLLGELMLSGAAAGRLDERREISTVELRSHWTYLQTQSLLWDFGAEATFERADLGLSRQERFATAAAVGFNRLPDATLASTRAPRSSTGGLFVSARREWRNLEAEFGARLDGQDYRGFGAHSQLSPRINLRFDPAPVWHVYGSWGHFQQAQRPGEWRLEENQSSPDPVTHAVNVVAGVSHDSSPVLHWGVEVYDNHWLSVHPYFDNSLNRLALLPELGIDRVRIAPRGGDSAGVEASARGDVGNDVILSASYVLSRAADDLPGGDVLRSWDQTHAFNANIAWRHALSSAALLISWHSGWPMTPVTLVPASGGTPAYLQIGPRNSGRWGSYFSADVRLARTIALRMGDVLLWADATNLTNRANPCCTAVGHVDQAGNLSVPATTSWFPRFVNVGFEWRLHAGR